MTAIHIRNLTKTYGRGRKRFNAVDNLTLEVPQGVVYGFLGPNGAGKTTTIRMIFDLIRPSGGEVYIYGKPIRTEHEVLRRVGAIIEGPAFYNYLSGRKNLQVLARTMGQDDHKRIDGLLNRSG